MEKILDKITVWAESHFGENAIIVDILLAFIQIVLIILLARVISRFLRFLIRRSFDRYAKRKNDPEITRKAQTLSQILRGVVKYVVYFTAVLLVLDELGLGASVNSLLATAGIGGIAIGFGAQSLIADVTNGFFLLLEDQYAVGDFVKIGDISGWVKKISLRTTQLEMGTKELVMIPNGQIKMVTNYSRQNYMAMFDVLVTADADIDFVIELARQAAQEYKEANEHVKGDVVSMGVVKVQPGVVTIRTGMLVAPMTHFKTINALSRIMAERLREHGIRSPKEGQIIING